jgi:lipoprotein-anchoring transpeptidase ErfK/SrfK
MADRSSQLDVPPFREVAAARSRLDRVLGAGRDVRWLLISAARQRLWLMAGDRPLAAWPVSTAAAGLDAREDSGGTPPGVHVVDRRIGTDMEPGTVFRSRAPTGEIWSPEAPPRDDDLILARILTLDGREDGVNRGPGVDSRRRYIYIHGTNHESRLGEPLSHGCIRMACGDVMTLFDRVEEGDPVVIV